MDGFAIPNSDIKGNFFDWALLKKILRLAAPFKRQFYIATFFALFLAALAPIRPWLIQLTVGTMLMLGTGKMTLDEFQAVIKKKGTFRYVLAVPGCGLSLTEVKYPYL